MKELYNNIDVFKLEEAITVFNKRNVPDILTRDIILFLLYARKDKPIYGRTMLISQVFLLYKQLIKIQNLRIQTPVFVERVLEDLIFSGYINSKGKKNTRKERFTITECGIKEIKEKWEKLSEDLKKEIEIKRLAWDQMGIDGILKYIRKYYPEKYKMVKQRQ